MSDFSIIVLSIVGLLFLYSLLKLLIELKFMTDKERKRRKTVAKWAFIVLLIYVISPIDLISGLPVDDIPAAIAAVFAGIQWIILLSIAKKRDIKELANNSVSLKK